MLELNGARRSRAGRGADAASRPRRHAIFTSSTRPWTASRTGTPARRTCTGWATTSTARPILSTTTSRWTARPRPSPRRGCCGSGHWLRKHGRRRKQGARYWQAGLTVLNTLFDDPYLSTDADHQGLILHSVYHRPNGWDHIPPGGEDALRGIQHVGRLPRPRGGAVCAAGDRGRSRI